MKTTGFDAGWEERAPRILSRRSPYKRFQNQSRPGQDARAGFSGRGKAASGISRCRIVKHLVQSGKQRKQRVFL